MIKYFKPYEFFESDTANRLGIANVPSDFTAYNNIVMLAFYLDSVRNRFGSALHINSGFRCAALNSAVGGVKNSRHLLGLAVDIRVSHNSDYEKLRYIIGSDCRFIKYYPDRHYCHVDFESTFLFNYFIQHAYEK